MRINRMVSVQDSTTVAKWKDKHPDRPNLKSAVSTNKSKCLAITISFIVLQYFPIYKTDKQTYKHTSM